MSRRSPLLLALALLVACTNKPTPGAVPSDAAPEPLATFRIVGTPPPKKIDESAPYVGSPAVTGKSVGHTSVVFKLELENGKKIAFKASWKQGPSRWKSEVAAYELGKALGIPNVPPAYPRSFQRLSLLKAIAQDEKAKKLYDEQVVVEDGIIHGAAIPWIEDLEFLALEKEPWWTKWRGWLKKGARIPDDQKDLARQASNLVVFDYVIGNWDRMSGANVGFDRARNTLLFVDNDAAFFAPVPKDGLARNKALLTGCDRFSKSLVRALRETKVVDTLDLEQNQRDGVKTRVREVLDYVDAKAGDAGEDETLFFN